MTPLAHSRFATVTVLGITQTLAWASSYYIPAMLAPAMANDLGLSTQAVFAAFSICLILSALLGPWAGKMIDILGGRPVLVATNLIFALGLACLGLSEHIAVFLLGWLLVGVGMGAGLYEAAFATLVRLYGTQSRNAITGVTLFGGFASTVSWPLTGWLEVNYDWRIACFAWAALHIVVGLPLNALLPGLKKVHPGPSTQKSVAASANGRGHQAGAANAAPTAAVSVSAPEPRITSSEHSPPALSARRSLQASLLLALVFANTWFISTALAAHLPALLQSAGLTLAGAVALGALIGPAQVAGRLMEFGFLRHLHPLLAAKMATLTHPIGAFLLLVLGGPAGMVFAILHGLGNGILTIAKGTLPLVIFGASGYGHRQGVLMIPARLAQATSPFVFGWMINAWGTGALVFSSALGVVSFAAMWVLGRITRA